VITGLTRGTTSAHVARATLEAMALQNVEIILAMASNLDGDLKELKVDGGAVSNNLLMQLQSDYLMASLLRPKNIETTSAGAAFLAGLAEGFWSSVSDIERSWGEQASFQPQITSEQQQARLKAWSRAIEASKFMAGANSW
jgi:glycerol kinase